MPVPIQCKKEGKEILDKINELLPWEKGELLTYIVNSVMTEDEIEKYFIEGSGYVRWDDIDHVKEVINEGLEEDVLDEMNDTDICDYLINSYNFEGARNLRYMAERMHWEDVAEAIATINKKDSDCIIDELFKNHRDSFIAILNYFNHVLVRNGKE